MSNTKNQNENKALMDTVKTVGVGCLCGICTICVLYAVIAVVMQSVHLPSSVFSPITIVCCCIGAFVAGYTISRVNKQNGLILGIISACLIFLCFSIFGMMFSDLGFGTLAFVKLMSMCLCGALGGTMGVNKKTRRK